MEEGLVKDISNGLENVPICVDVGPNEDLPQKFHYIRCCISGPGVTLPEGPLYPGCECKDECSVNANCSCIGKFGPAYETKNDTLVMANSTTQVNNGVSQPVFECNSSCSCSLFCGNRLIQNGITTRLQVFKTGGDSASENKQFIGQNSRPDMTRICHCKTTKCTGYLPCNSSLF
ncbi:histone-lysine N-methyltransferase SETMAR-like isoform X2 [Actinia tenebrosa]|uniref:Histone-lysine N-methyltransferase SETMAR-like isoform X2 n=1 Tax=Actinia tenebrosa TaxID=6105 RepID=A0A6P8IH49_ACTTE|nr:histone-lysine N-methyltransferase SETMAR-like isoform X2 [Actinia tenebrosa]